MRRIIQLLLSCLLIFVCSGIANAEENPKFISGTQQTQNWWDEFMKGKTEIEGILKSMYEQVFNSHRNNEKAVSMVFYKWLEEAYPGSSGGCSSGVCSGKIVIGDISAEFGDYGRQWGVHTLTEKGAISTTCSLQGGASVKIANGVDTVKFMLGQYGYYFSEVNIPEVEAFAEEVLQKKSQPEKTYRNGAFQTPVSGALAVILNDIYQMKYDGLGLSMNEVAKRMLTNPMFRQEVFTMASNYYEGRALSTPVTPKEAPSFNTSKMTAAQQSLAIKQKSQRFGPVSMMMVGLIAMGCIWVYQKRRVKVEEVKRRVLFVKSEEIAEGGKNS